MRGEEEIRKLKEKIDELEEEVSAEKLQEILEEVIELENLERKEKVMESLVRWYRDFIPITERGYREWRKKYSLKELNNLFKGIFKFENCICGSQPGERILKREFSPGNVWCRNISRSTKVRILSSQIEVWDKIEEILHKSGK